MSFKNIKQNENGFCECKDKINTTLLNAMMNDSISREEARIITNQTDTKAREDVRLISMFYPVISYSKKDVGYRIVNINRILTKNNAIKEIEEIDTTLKELDSRIICLKKRMKCLIGAKKTLQRKWNIQERREDEFGKIK